MSKKKDQPIAPDEALGKAEAFIIKHKVAFIAAIVAIIALAALKAFNVFAPEEKGENKEANAAIASIEPYFQSNMFNEALNGTEEFAGLLEITETYAGTTAANKAHLYAGNIYALQKNYDEAIAHLSKYQGSDNIIAAQAKRTLGNCYSQIDNYETALSLLLEAASLGNNVAVTPACWRDAAAIYEAQGNSEEAMKLYNRINDEFPMSPIAQEALTKINAAAK